MQRLRIFREKYCYTDQCTGLCRRSDILILTRWLSLSDATATPNVRFQSERLGEGFVGVEDAHVLSHQPFDLTKPSSPERVGGNYS